MSIDPERRAALLKAKLRGLVRTRWAGALDRARDGSLSGGAALVSDGTVWALGEDDPARSLGPSLAWARKNGGTALHLLVGSEAETIARRARRFDLPITVWRVDGATLNEAQPAPLPPDPPRPAEAQAFASMFATAGADAVFEGGILRAEVLGLEVARVVHDESAGSFRLEVGVGKHDRAAHTELRGTGQGLDELFEVVRVVADARRPGREGHDAFHLAPERWLRCVVRTHPEVVGAQPGSLEFAPSPVPRPDLRRQAPAPLRGTTESGAPLLVMCSVGLDLDVMSAAADAYERDGREPELVLCIPSADAYPAVRELAALHRPPARVVTVGGDWRAL